MITIKKSKVKHSIGLHELILNNDDTIYITFQEANQILTENETVFLESLHDKKYYPVFSEVEFSHEIALLKGFQLVEF